MLEHCVRRWPYPLRLFPGQGSSHRVSEQLLLFPQASARRRRSPVGNPWPTLVACAGTLLVLLAPSRVADFGHAPNRESHASIGALPAYDDYIRAAAIRYGVQERLVTAIITVESEFNPHAVSRKGASGLMQLMPGTAATVGVRDRLDAPQNIDGGVRHLRALMDRYPNNLALALAAYNAGEQRVAVYGGIPPYPETRRFVVRVLRRLGDRRAVEKVLAQAAPRGERGKGRKTSLGSASSRESAVRAAGTRDVPDRAMGPSAKARSQELANRRTGDANVRPTGESIGSLPTPRPQPAVSLGAAAPERRSIIQAP